MSGARLVIASRDGARVWAGGDTLADIMATVAGFLDDGYTVDELIIEGVTA